MSNEKEKNKEYKCGFRHWIGLSDVKDSKIQFRNLSVQFTLEKNRYEIEIVPSFF